MERRVMEYWMISWVFAIIFGELIPAFLSINPAFFQHYIAIGLYYAVLCLILSILFSRMKWWMVLIVIFIYGGLAEVLFFKGIDHFIVAGLFYDFLFGVPYWITVKIWKGKNENF